MHSYRTTFSPSPRVARAIRELARREGKSVSRIVDELLQAALDQSGHERNANEGFKVEPFALNLRPGLDPTRLKDILTDLEVEHE